MADASERLRQAAFEKVATCRHGIHEGQVDLSGLEESVREYCKAIARLPKDEGQAHEQALKSLVLEVEALGAELTIAHEAIRKELEGLGRLKQANVAYHKSYAVSPVTLRKEEED